MIGAAPRNFPNALLHELDQMEFYVRATDERIEGKIEVVITRPFNRSPLTSALHGR